MNLGENGVEKEGII